jgi:hypothetical protein
MASSWNWVSAGSSVAPAQATWKVNGPAPPPPSTSLRTWNPSEAGPPCGLLFGVVDGVVDGVVVVVGT